MPAKFELEITYGITKSLPATEDASIEDIKVAGMGPNPDPRV